ncbi:transposase family protein [Micromonospora sp. LOL_023]|uniref:transposase family protein n=1 Tax=Micromonospora sp. LOL_023 TaxID=3345418 RepID=UPI003A8A2EDC
MSRARTALLVILVLTACATLVAGNYSLTTIRQWAARTPQDVLHRLDPLTSRYLVPSERTCRRVLTAVDGDALDLLTPLNVAIHGIVGRDAAQAGPQHLNAYLRGHWFVSRCEQRPATG